MRSFGCQQRIRWGLGNPAHSIMRSLGTDTSCAASIRMMEHPMPIVGSGGKREQFVYPRHRVIGIRAPWCGVIGSVAFEGAGEPFTNDTIDEMAGRPAATFNPSTHEMVAFVVERMPQVDVDNLLDDIGWRGFDDKSDRLPV